LMRLPVQSRTILVLREYQSFSYQEIADVLDVPLGTVKSRLSDARRRLKVELTGYVNACPTKRGDRDGVAVQPAQRCEKRQE